MPQGGLDEGEEPEAGARRELAEETGVTSARSWRGRGSGSPTISRTSLIGIAWEGRYRGQKQLWFAARFEGPESEIDLGPREGHEQEFDAWQWVTLAELPALVVPFKRKVYLSVIEQLGAVARSG